MKKKTVAQRIKKRLTEFTRKLERGEPIDENSHVVEHSDVDRLIKALQAAWAKIECALKRKEHP